MHLDYVQQTLRNLMKENGFTLKKIRNNQTIKNSDYAKLVFLANTPVQDKFLWTSLEQAAKNIDLNMDSHKTEFVCFEH